MTTYRNEHGPVEILGPGPLTDTYLRVRMDDVLAYLISLQPEYLVWADTLRFRRDDQPHPLDVREMVVVSKEEIEGSDETVSVKVQVKA
ncbi:hypothetical protein ASF69_01545 [Rhizobium sp. Leaf311]|uniref:hypothetical protein n=1 Tax=Rhizobium sp. Leaf311 TaxID=1736332 RepID=UPI000713D90A|nr:hypothetical protein [Rhizobium sp. Leaf311]KQQ61134.1 hypothetical protein ASF69_01545 [Rhizobium sp. Leaf311]